jgi:quercetin dioxygenase-like cupin family protein
MTKRFGILVLGALAVLALAPGAQAEEQKAKAPSKAAAGGKAVLIPIGEMKWTVPPNSPPGVQMAVLWGDPAKGAFGALHKFAPGFSVPLHFHSAGYHCVVISGTFIQAVEGEAEKSLTSGSYVAYTGKKKHATKCAPGAECIVFIDAGGAWDVVLADAGTAAAKR